MSEKELAGNVKISEDVIATIASVTAQKIEGIAGMSAGLIDGISGLLGKKNTNKGVRITLGEHDVAVELLVEVNYGSKIPDVAWNAQQSIKKEIETMTGLTVTKVDIKVESIKMPAATDSCCCDDTCKDDACCEGDTCDDDCDCEDEGCCEGKGDTLSADNRTEGVAEPMTENDDDHVATKDEFEKEIIV